MAVTFELPVRIEQTLRNELASFEDAVKEAALVELYRQDKLSHRELSEALGVSRLETEAILKQHNVTEDFGTAEEYAQELALLRLMT